MSLNWQQPNWRSGYTLEGRAQFHRASKSLSSQVMPRWSRVREALPQSPAKTCSSTAMGGRLLRGGRGSTTFLLHRRDYGLQDNKSTMGNPVFMRFLSTASVLVLQRIFRILKATTSCFGEQIAAEANSVFGKCWICTLVKELLTC